MSVKGIANQNSVVLVYSITEETQFQGFYVSPGSAETLVSRGGITIHCSLAYSLSNISAKNCQNRLMYV